MHDAMKENYYALLLCILKPSCTIDTSLQIMIDGVFKKENATIGKPDIEDMIRLKQKMTYEEIGEIYGLSKQAVYRRIKRYKEAVK